MYLVLAWLFILLRQGTNGGQGANLSYWVDKSIFRAFFVFKDEKNYVFYFLHKTLHFNFVVRIVWFLNWWMTDDNWLWKLHCLAVNCVSPPHFELLILWACLLIIQTSHREKQKGFSSGYTSQQQHEKYHSFYNYKCSVCF